MIILIAEAKTMEKVEKPISIAEYEAHKPSGEVEATSVMARIATMDIADIAKVVKISTDMATALKRMAYEFRNKSLGFPAIEAFTGVVFKHLSFSHLSAEAKERCSSDVFIISSLYGLLRCDDIIKPYRFEYTTPLSPDDKPLWAWAKGRVTDRLLSMIAAKGDAEILDLLPADAARCVDWKRIQACANVRKVEFLEVGGEKVKSPHAGKLKALRGQILRHILQNDVTTLADVAAIHTDDFMPVEARVADALAFYV